MLYIVSTNIYIFNLKNFPNDYDALEFDRFLIGTQSGFFFLLRWIFKCIIFVVYIVLCYLNASAHWLSHWRKKCQYWNEPERVREKEMGKNEDQTTKESNDIRLVRFDSAIRTNSNFYSKKNRSQAEKIYFFKFQCFYGFSMFCCVMKYLEKIMFDLFTGSVRWNETTHSHNTHTLDESIG